MNNRNDNYGQDYNNGNYDQNYYNDNYGQNYDNSNYGQYYNDGNYSQSYNDDNYGQYYNDGNYDQAYNGDNYGQTYNNGSYNQNYNNGNYGQSYNDENYGQYYNNGNYAADYQNVYYNQNFETFSTETGGITDIIFAIIGMIGNIVLFIATFVPMIKEDYYGENDNIFLWDYFKLISRVIKHMHNDDAPRLTIFLITVTTAVIIAVMALVYIIIYIVVLCSKKRVSKHLISNVSVVMMLFFMEYTSMKAIYSYKTKSVSSVMIMIALSILVVSCLLSGYTGNMQQAKRASLTYHLQFVFNFMISIFSGTLLFCSFSAIAKSKYDYGTEKYGLSTFLGGFIGYLDDIIYSIDRGEYVSLSTFKNSCKMLSIIFVIVMIAITIINLQIKNLKETIFNIHYHFNLGSRVMVRSIISVILLITLQIMVSVNHNKLGVKSAPSTFFVVFMIFSWLNLIVLIVKKILESAVPNTCIEIVAGSKKKLRKQTISSIILNSIGLVMLIFISVFSIFTYDWLENKVKNKIDNSYYDDYYDYDDDYYYYDYDDYDDDYDWD